MRSRRKIRGRSGFTLIELSITLVIIGLIVGGVLVGRDLIKAAEIRGEVTQIEQINSAVNTFRLKYNCLPGDCNNVTQFFGATSQPEKVTNGDGDGMICGYCSTPNQDWNWGGTEWLTAYDHLAAAGLINLGQYDETVSASVYGYPGIGFPSLIIRSSGNGNEVSVSYGQVYRLGGISIGYESPASYNTGGHRIRLGTGLVLENNGPWAGNIGFPDGLNPSESFALDTKIDDGKPYSGGMVLMADFYVYRIPGWSGTTLDGTYHCGDYASNAYRSDTFSIATSRSCAPSIRAGF